MFPVFAKVQHDREELKKGYLATVSFLSFVNTAILCCFAAVAADAVPVIFGAKWNGSIPVFQVLCVVMIARCIGNPSGALSLAKGKADIGFYWNCILLAVSVPAVIVGFRFESIIGVAEALLVVQLVCLFPFYFFYLKKFLGPCGWQYTIKAFSHPVWGGIGMALVAASSPLLIQYNGVARLIVKTVFFVIVYGALECATNFKFIKTLLSRSAATPAAP